MDPKHTFAEIARILRPGGVFAACDCDWPPTMNWEAEAAFRMFRATFQKVEKRIGVSKGVRKWPKEEHLARMKASRQFRFTKEIVCHQVESGNADRLVGLAMSQGGVAAILKHGLAEEEVGLAALREAAERLLGKRMKPWYFSYRVRVGVK
jgi:SAM-dependent methyltransferase